MTKPFINIEDVQKVYAQLAVVQENSEKNRRNLTLAEKILYAHVYLNGRSFFQRQIDYVNFIPDRVAMQDATAQMALLQLMTAGNDKVAVSTSVHCDHLIQAKDGAVPDLAQALDVNKEVYDFLQSVSNKFGIGFWKPGSGIIHQIVLENYAFPGGLMIGTDSHTPNAGGLGMMAIGVGGADACDVMAGLPWELKMPKIIGVKLSGRLSGWASAKDVILKLAGILTVKGGTDAVIEYFGEGTETLSATGKATICNMGAEVGATCSIFPYDKNMEEYLKATNREDIAKLANKSQFSLKADPEVYAYPQNYYDEVVEIDLSALEPHINGPFTPDLATPISLMAHMVEEKKWPKLIDVALIGSCTNSSYEDMVRANEVALLALNAGIKRFKSEVVITPGSQQIYDTAKRDRLFDAIITLGGKVLANACGPCIGQWARHMKNPEAPNTILTSYNRNFAKRNDGNSSTHCFVASPEIVVALALAGTLKFNPLRDSLYTDDGTVVHLSLLGGPALPTNGFVSDLSCYQAPAEDGSNVEVIVSPESERLQLLEPFAPWDGMDMLKLPLLIKVEGKCTTDHISPAGKWLTYRGHLEQISENMLIGAVNVFNKKTDLVLDVYNEVYGTIFKVQRSYKAARIGSLVVGEFNYGEGSSREHAAMEPRFMGVKAILVKSFARIHETNLKKQGMLALIFANEADYDKIQETDFIDIVGLTEFAPGKPLTITLHHVGGSSESFIVNHTYNEQQIEWFKAGSALNYLNSKVNS